MRTVERATVRKYSLEIWRMQKTIWTCWLQGRQQAPELVRKCLLTWEERNPAWDFRFLDARTISRYVELTEHLDLLHQVITPQALTDVLRLLLLYEYGGVWVDATAYCNAPLDNWLPSAADNGFFAFSRRSASLPLGNWFLAARPDNLLLMKCVERALEYWKGRQRNPNYWWFHHLFAELCTVDVEARRAWESIPRISVDGAFSIQAAGMHGEFDEVRTKVDWTAPVFKLGHRPEDASRMTPNCFIARFLKLREIGG